MFKSLVVFFKEIEVIFLGLIEHLEWFPRFFYYTARILKFEEYKGIYLTIVTLIIILIIINIFFNQKNKR
jgi:hypothetical protein